MTICNSISPAFVLSCNSSSPGDQRCEIIKDVVGSESSYLNKISFITEVITKLGSTKSFNLKESNKIQNPPTEPEVSFTIAESFHVIGPVSKELHVSADSSLKHLKRNSIKQSIFLICSRLWFTILTPTRSNFENLFILNRACSQRRKPSSFERF